MDIENHMTSVEVWNANWREEGCPLPKKCPECNRIWRDTANFCGFCGVKLKCRVS